MLKKFENNRTSSCDKEKGFSETKKMLISVNKNNKSKKFYILINKIFNF